MKKYLSVRVRQLENKNQFVMRTSEGGYIFQSYDSICCINQDGKLILGSDWDYSNTTRKHLYIFINDYCSLSGYTLEEREKIDKALTSNNRRKALQELINKGIIEYDRTLY